MIRRQRKKIASIGVILFVTISMMVTGCGNKPAEQSADGCRITFMDTGKSDCILIEMDGVMILNDTADEDDYKMIEQTLEEKDVQKIDYMIISHFDKDHIGSAPELIRNFKVDSVIMPDFWGDSSLYQDMIAAIQETDTEQVNLDQTYEIVTGEGKISINAPELSTYDDENNYSLITSVSYGETDFLLMGDALKQRTEEFANAMSADQTYDLIKIPHHGDYNKKMKTIVQNCRPSYAVITAASDDTIEQKLVDLLTENQVKLFKTYDGEIIAQTDGTTLTVTQ